MTYVCADGTCLKKPNPECDSVADCPDASDEKQCGEMIICTQNNTHKQYCLLKFSVVFNTIMLISFTDYKRFLVAMHIYYEVTL